MSWHLGNWSWSTLCGGSRHSRLLVLVLVLAEAVADTTTAASKDVETGLSRRPIFRSNVSRIRLTCFSAGFESPLQICGLLLYLSLSLLLGFLATSSFRLLIVFTFFFGSFIGCLLGCALFLFLASSFFSRLDITLLWTQCMRSLIAGNWWRWRNLRCLKRR